MHSIWLKRRGRENTVDLSSNMTWDMLTETNGGLVKVGCLARVLAEVI
jgi:hypothetical protein